MANVIGDLIDRVGGQIKKHPEWFEMAKRWYDNARLTKRVLFDLWKESEPTSKPRLSVNGKFLDEGAKGSSARHVFWLVPPSLLHVGDNDVIVWIERKEGPVLTFGTVAVELAQTLPGDVRQRSRPQPPPSEQVSVIFRLGEDYRPARDRWLTQIHHDTLKFHLTLAENVPSNFTLGVATLLPGGGYELDFEVLWKIIEDQIKAKIKELIKEKLQLEGKSLRIAERKLEDLRAYQTLHREQLEPAVLGDDDGTLQEVIDRTGKPEKLVESATPRQRGMSGAGRFFVFLLLVVIGVWIAWANGWIDRQTVQRAEAAWNQVWKKNKGGFKGPGQNENLIAQVLKDKGAKTGDVQVTLFWTNKNDLDLHVTPPSGEMVSFRNRRSRCGGQLDVDMNVRYQDASAQAVENIYWPVQQAPKGRYKVDVHYYTKHNQPDCQDPTRYTVRVVIHGHTQWFHGEMVKNDPTRNHMSHEFEVR